MFCNSLRRFFVKISTSEKFIVPLRCFQPTENPKMLEGKTAECQKKFPRHFFTEQNFLPNSDYGETWFAATKRKSELFFLLSEVCSLYCTSGSSVLLPLRVLGLAVRHRLAFDDTNFSWYLSRNVFLVFIIHPSLFASMITTSLWQPNVHFRIHDWLASLPGLSRQYGR